MMRALPVSLPSRAWLEGALVALVLAGLTAGIYGQTAKFGYVWGWDDLAYVLHDHVRGGFTWENIVWAWTDLARGSLWAPLLYMSFQLDAVLFNLAPGALHTENAVLHWLNCLLLFLLVRRLGGDKWVAVVASALFCVSPICVESVSWIAEKKNLLSQALFLGAMLAYLSPRAKIWQWTVLGVMAFLVKPSTVVLPVLLLVIDILFSQRRLASAIQEKLVLYAAAFAVGLMTIHAEQVGGSMSPGHWEWALSAIAVYLAQTFWPAPGSFVFWVANPVDVGMLPLVGALSLAVLVGTVLVSWRRAPLVVFGLCWFLLSVSLVCGYPSLIGQWHADRFMYLPVAGLLVGGVAALPRRIRLLPLAAVPLLAVLSFHLVKPWENDVTRFGPLLVDAAIDNARPDEQHGATVEDGLAYLMHLTHLAAPDEENQQLQFLLVTNLHAAGRLVEARLRLDWLLERLPSGEGREVVEGWQRQTLPRVPVGARPPENGWARHIPNIPLNG